MDLELYYKEQYNRVINRYVKSKHSNFINKKGLADWYVSQLKKYDCKCYYCETSIHDIVNLIKKGSLKTRAVRGGGVRGPVLEIDKNEDIYSENTCVLSCYYCNNDKSYTLDKVEYKKYFGENRRKYFQSLIEQLI